MAVKLREWRLLDLDAKHNLVELVCVHFNLPSRLYSAARLHMQEELKMPRLAYWNLHWI